MASIFNFFKKETRDNGQTFLQNVLTGLSNTGVAVNQDTSLTYSAVFACVRVLSESVASLPIDIIKDVNGDKTVDKDHPVYKLLAQKPNNYMTSFTWRQILMTNLVLNGNSYFNIIRDTSARPVSLEYIPSENVDVKLQGGEIFYEIKEGGDGFGPTVESRIIKHDDMLHFQGLSYDGIKGRSVIETHRDSFGLSIAANKYGGAYYGNASSPSGILSHPGKLSKEAADRLKFSWNSSYGNGPMNAHKTAILEEGMSFKPVSMNPEDADFLNTRKFQVTEIARIFRVPPHMIGDLDRATFTNIEQQGIDFLTHTLRPYLINLEEELERKLFRENEQDTYKIMFNANGMLRGDSEARAKFYKDMSSIGVLSINDIRRMENMNDIGSDGDKHYYALNYAPIDAQSDVDGQ
tara:strand:- start:3261 stop:4481 length:1221 start_codon:yes stop_codon:yes gene_type:complete